MFDVALFTVAKRANIMYKDTQHNITQTLEK